MKHNKQPLKKEAYNKKEHIALERMNILTEQTPYSTLEEYKILRTNIIFSTLSEQCKIIGITSDCPGAGKSITCLNLAITFAETKSKVLLVDCDLRLPKISQLLNLSPTPGITNVLIDMNHIEDAIHHVGQSSLDIILSGDIPPNPSELLGSAQLNEALAILAQQYDYIFIDTPPVNLVSDASVLSKQLTGMILVVRAGISEKDGVISAINQLQFVGTNLLGFILNGTYDKKTRKNKRYYNNYIHN